MKRVLFLFLAVFVVGLFFANLFWGSLSIPAEAVCEILSGKEIPQHPSWYFIVWENRLPQAVTALFCGAALSLAGLLLQTSFRNPLAGPSILGIDSGAQLGVALCMLCLGGNVQWGSLQLGGFMLVICAALVGALCVMCLLLSLSHFLQSALMLLITGVVLSAITGSLISLLSFMASHEGVHAYVMWGMGSFSGISLERLPWFVALSLLGIFMGTWLIKPLDTLLLGDNYAASLGINTQRVRHLLLLATGILTATNTAFCGPISFLGLAVPHLARMTVRTSRHCILLPATLLMGAALALLCNLCSTTCLSAGSLLPINVITPLIGAPIILYVILRHSRR